jgi:hypothetical protein
MVPRIYGIGSKGCLKYGKTIEILGFVGFICSKKFWERSKKFSLLIFFVIELGI